MCVEERVSYVKECQECKSRSLVKVSRCGIKGKSVGCRGSLRIRPLVVGIRFGVAAF